MRLILVDNLIYDDSYGVRSYDVQPHLGLLSLAAVARGVGHPTQIYDPKWHLLRGGLVLDASLYRNMARQILERVPQVVGFTALGCNFHCVVKVASCIRHLQPNLPILLGGPHATILHREILERFSAFDVIVRSEAEETLPALLDRLGSRDLAGVPGVSYRTKQGEVVCNSGSPIIHDLDRLPFPAYECYPLGELGLTTIRVEAGRGCPFSCTFCSTASFFGRNYRLKSTPRLLAEMDYLRDGYGYTDFKLSHDLFTVNRKKIVEFCDALSGRQYTWSCSARVDCVDQELLNLMSQAGCRSIYFGIETGSGRMQEISRKRLDLRLVEPMLEVTTRLGIKTTTSFITGYPEETLEDQNATLDFAGRLSCRPDGLNESQLHLLTPEPGTQLMTEYGDRLQFDGYITDFNFPRLEPDEDALLADNAIIFGNHHYFPTALPRQRNIFVASMWSSLWVTSRVMLAYILRGFDGRLSRFVDAAYDWHGTARPRSWNFGTADLVLFLARRFGDRHHIVSLLRYADAVRTLLRAKRAMTGNEVPRTDEAAMEMPLGVGRDAAVLRDIHDCIDLMEKIAADTTGELLTDASVGPLGHMLLIRRPRNRLSDQDPNPVVAYLIDGATADLIDRFEEPKSYWQCCREIADADDASRFPDWRDVQWLRELGVLEGRSGQSGFAEIDVGRFAPRSGQVWSTLSRDSI